jgi:hypothetical protein
MGQFHLSVLYRKLFQETDWLLNEFDNSLSALAASQYASRSARLAAEMAVIRLHDSWSRFSRQLIIISAGGRPYTNSGVRLGLAPGVREIRDVIPTLMSTYRRRTFEPNWARPHETIDAAQRLRIPNFSTIAAALGSVNLPAEDMRPFRNFLAHRGRDTAIEVRNQSFMRGIPRVCVEFTAGDLVQPGVTRFEQWIINFRLVASSSIQ